MTSEIELMNAHAFNEGSSYLDSSRRWLVARGYHDFIRRSLHGVEIASFADIGCGIGFVTETIKGFHPAARATGVDVSQELVRVAAKRLGDGADFLVGSAYELPIETSTQDLVVAQTVFMHLGNPERALSEMIRVAKVGGRVLVIEPIMHECGSMSSYVPGPGSIRVENRRKLFAFERARKAEVGIDMQIAMKMPDLFLRSGLKALTLETFNAIGLESESECDLEEHPLRSHYRLMINLGYPRAEIEQANRDQRRFRSVRGAFNIQTLLATMGVK